VALDLTFEHHLLARPSLATEMHKQKEKENMHRTIKIQHEHQTSTSALQMLNPYVDKNDWLVLAGKKQAGCASLQWEKQVFKVSDRKEYQCLE
jgi:hypothetical protein